ncbi:hypothetical protein QFC19_001781 [Naganishia cerealis]|uniref:Uncharacterized protein n=1 Tax=Naganishia cerealis TaxID=610337 RepID=A0ACC2WEA9_9TREE|nr:hypothetical protein QFC19_001781 [Naganishia cerealis]
MFHSALRPSKRDVVISLVTLFFAWITLGLRHGSNASSIYSHSYDQAAQVDPAKASWYGSHYIAKVSNKFSNFKSLWPGSAKELEQLEDVLCPTLSDGSHGSYIHKGYSDTVTRLSISADNDEEEDDDEGVSGGASHLIGHQPGWTIFENIYLYNGTLYVVTNDREQYPELRLMTSTGLPATSEPGNEEAREPTGKELMFISVREAKDLWGDRIWAMEGMTWLFNDGQYQAWRDKPRFNSAILWSAFPSISVLYQDDWQDIARATASGKPKAYYFPKAILADRSAAFRGQNTASTSRTVASAMMLGESNRWWWEPIRRQVLRFAGTPEDVLNRNLWGYGAINPATLDADPELQAMLGHPEVAQPANFKPLVTYISRQSSRRRLTPESHEDLVQALEKHSKAKGWELKIVEAEKLSKEEQLDLAARTTIMLGVHGNGLTHLLWMPPTPQSAVIEMFFVGGFARDLRHDQYATAPNEPKVDYPEGFQGTAITVVGEVVAQLIDDRLDGKV